MYQFTDDCKVGIKLIDEEHGKLFELINQAVELSQNGGGSFSAAEALLDELKSYALTHFSHEEEYMEQINDRELERQKKEHRLFKEKIDSYKLEGLSDEEGARVLAEILDFMAKWLYRHIIGSDTMIGKFTAKQENNAGEDIFSFTDAYKTGIEFVDEEHKRLFEIIKETNDVIKADMMHDKYDAIVNIINQLKDYTVKHFTDEEEYMEKIGYDGIRLQRIAHTAFVDRLNEIDLEDMDENQAEYLNDLVDFLLEWLINHIKNMDKRIPKEA